MIFIQFTQPGTNCNSPETHQWAVHGQPTRPTSVPLFGTEFHTHFRSYKNQSIIYSIIITQEPIAVCNSAQIAQSAPKNSNTSVPCFGTDQTAHSRHFSYQTYILMHNRHTNSPLISGQSRTIKKNLKKIPTIRS